MSLQDILRQVSQELETKACKGYPAVFSSPFPAVVTRCCSIYQLAITSGIRHQRHYHLIRLLSRTDPQDEQLVPVLRILFECLLPT